nr:CRISPR-associated endonuclease Cas3'' [Lujinxingiaceae bacterium]
PLEAFAAPQSAELCRVSIGQARGFLSKAEIEGWRFETLDGQWRKLTKQSGPRPGELILLASSTGGYDRQLGFTGPPAKKNADPTPPVTLLEAGDSEAMGDDPKSFIDTWVRLEDHTDHVVAQLTRLADALGIDARWRGWLETAARWHDLGKAHPVFQEMLLTPQPGSAQPAADPGILWAKSDHRRGRVKRRHFRHELASALAFIQDRPNSRETNAVAYIIAAHHGKVRLSIRSLPDEKRPKDDKLFARGIWHDDLLPATALGAGQLTDPIELDLSPMRLGPGSWLERCLDLRDATELGPFRLAFLESVLRLADQRASALEQQEKP